MADNERLQIQQLKQAFNRNSRLASKLTIEEKREILLNASATYVALRQLELNTSLPFEYWLEVITAVARNQVEKLSDEEVKRDFSELTLSQ